MVTHDSSVSVSSTATQSLQEQRSTLRQLRSELIRRYRPHIQEGPGPTRVMARLVAELEAESRKRHIAEEVIQSEIVNRTIGDINLRLVTECVGTPGGREDYRLLVDEVGIALPGEQLHSYMASGETYLWLRNQMMECERLLLADHYDPRIYDIYGVGNRVLRGWLAQDMRQEWGIDVSRDQLFLSMGAMDGIDKVLRGLAHLYRTRSTSEYGIIFPEPGFGVPEWQARSYGFRLSCLSTAEEDGFKLTASQLDALLQAAPNIRVVYLTVTNNPTTFAYTPAELRAIQEVLLQHRDRGHEVFVLADLAYVGTGKPEEDRARMATFARPEVLPFTIFVSSYSKTYSLTGERFGWVTCGDPSTAAIIAASWSNSTASLPGEWQLRYMAYHRLIEERPWLLEKLRALYRLRRTQLREQLEALNRKERLFEQIYLDDDATVYNWSKLATGEDAFSLFEKTGLAGVPGSGFGYSDAYIRFSIGFIPVTDAPR